VFTSWRGLLPDCPIARLPDCPIARLPVDFDLWADSVLKGQILHSCSILYHKERKKSTFLLWAFLTFETEFWVKMTIFWGKRQGLSKRR
jgi:hypothetical protein